MNKARKKYGEHLKSEIKIDTNQIIKTELDNINDVTEYLNFLKLYRKCYNQQLKTNSKQKYKYKNVTQLAVINVSSQDHTDTFPKRYMISNDFKQPIVSYGIIAIHNDKCVMVKRPSSFEYISFIIGQYDVSELYFLIRKLSPEERSYILNNTFEDLWIDILYIYQSLTDVEKEYALKKYNYIREFIPLFFDTIESSPDSLWLFPKGRRDSLESPIESAIREFNEETGVDLKKHDFKYILPDPLCISWYGSNSKKYISCYFVVSVSSEFELPEIIMSEGSFRPISTNEVSEREWVLIKDLTKYITPSKEGNHNSCKHDDLNSKHQEIIQKLLDIELENIPDIFNQLSVWESCEPSIIYENLVKISQ